MSSECSCRNKFSQSMSDHIFCHIYAYELFSIVDSKRKSDHIRNYVTCPISYLDNFLVSGFVHLFYFDEYLFIHIESFF